MKYGAGRDGIFPSRFHPYSYRIKLNKQTCSAQTALIIIQHTKAIIENSLGAVKQVVCNLQTQEIIGISPSTLCNVIVLSIHFTLNKLFHVFIIFNETQYIYAYINARTLTF